MDKGAPEVTESDASQAIIADPSWAEETPAGVEGAAIARVILSAERIAARVRALGGAITDAYAPNLATQPGARLLVAVTLRGAALFAADLVRAIDLPIELDFLSVASYGENTTSSGSVRFRKDLETDITDCHVLLVEDILDTGLTLTRLVETLAARNPASLRVCALLDKGRDFPLRASGAIAYTGFLIPDVFVVGYGLDYAERYRNLPYIGVLKPGIYTHASEEA